MSVGSGWITNTRFPPENLSTRPKVILKSPDSYFYLVLKRVFVSTKIFSQFGKYEHQNPSSVPWHTLLAHCCRCLCDVVWILRPRNPSAANGIRSLHFHLQAATCWCAVSSRRRVTQPMDRGLPGCLLTHPPIDRPGNNTDCLHTPSCDQWLVAWMGQQ